VEGENRLLILRKKTFNEFIPTVIIGHDHKTGAAGLALAKTFEVPYVHFVHTVPEGAEQHKTRGEQRTPLDGSRKADVQKRLCKESDLVACVGPLVHRIMQTTLIGYSIPVVEFRPGMDEALLQKKIDPTKILATYCLFMGRLEDGILKGADIACHVIAELNRNWQWGRHRSPRLILRGFEEQSIDRDLEALGEIARPYVMPRGYTSDAGAIVDDICMSSILMMPSRVEAFGLVALEGIAAGIPVLVPGSSGVGELLTILATELSIPEANACVLDQIGEDMRPTVEQWAIEAHAVLSDLPAAFAKAEKLRSTLKPILSWESAAKGLTADIESILIAPNLLQRVNSKH
jgi:glycosyltransferase involved in cell wall biosynthesis